MTTTLGIVVALLGAVVVTVALLRRRQPDQPTQTLPVTAGLAMTVLGVVALSVTTLAGNDDDSHTNSDGAAADNTEGTTASADAPTNATAAEVPADPPATRAPSPDCVDTHLSQDPIVREENRVRIPQGVNISVSPDVATALELTDDNEVIAVVRVIHEPLDAYVHVYDVVDATCTPVPGVTATNVGDDPDNPTEALDDATRTTLDLPLGDRDYVLTFDGESFGHTYEVTLLTQATAATTSTTAG